MDGPFPLPPACDVVTRTTRPYEEIGKQESGDGKDDIEEV